MGNMLKTTILLALLSGLLLVIGDALGGRTGLMMALVLAAVMNFGSYWFSDKIVLSMYRAQPVGPATRCSTRSSASSSAPACRCRGSSSSRRLAQRLRDGP